MSLSAGGRLVNGQCEGMWKWNAENGTLRQWGPFKNGKQHGVWKRCYGSTGQICDVGRWENGKRVGVWKFYAKDGALKRERKY